MFTRFSNSGERNHFVLMISWLFFSSDSGTVGPWNPFEMLSILKWISFINVQLAHIQPYFYLHMWFSALAGRPHWAMIRLSVMWASKKEPTDVSLFTCCFGLIVNCEPLSLAFHTTTTDLQCTYISSVDLRCASLSSLQITVCRHKCTRIHTVGSYHTLAVLVLHWGLAFPTDP